MSQYSTFIIVAYVVSIKAMLLTLLCVQLLVLISDTVQNSCLIYLPPINLP